MTQQNVPDSANVIAFPPLIYGTAVVIGLVVHNIIPLHFLPSTPARWLGILLVLLSIMIVTSAYRALARAKTTFDVRKPTTAIVSDGAFRYSRNPMYLSLTLLYFGIAFLVNSLWLLLLVLPVVIFIQWGVIEREERYLERKFGQVYLLYKGRVRRWV
jgi:protein-S-isoprenylcysteine O-methyltransferase Ste14